MAHQPIRHCKWEPGFSAFTNFFDILFWVLVIAAFAVLVYINYF